MTDQYESYVRRADENQRRAAECKRKALWRPESAATYHYQHDEALAEMYFNDAMARGYSSAAADWRQQLADLRGTESRGSAFVESVFGDTLNRMIDRALKPKDDQDA